MNRLNVIVIGLLAAWAGCAHAGNGTAAHILNISAASATGVAGQVSSNAGSEFNSLTPGGAEFDFRVNDDGVTVTLLKGSAGSHTSLVIPAVVKAFDTSFRVTKIDDAAFRTIPGYESPLQGVKNLVIQEGIVSMGILCFANAPDLESVAIPASLAEIPYMSFAECPKLTSVFIAADSKLTGIGSFAFDRCVSLTHFTIPDEVATIDAAPWRGCTSLKGLYVSSGNFSYRSFDGVLYSGHHGDLIQYPAGRREKDYRVRYGTKAIANAAFYGNPYIETVAMPASLDSISHTAFYDCRSLREVEFSGKIDFIGNKAFGECPALREITLYGNPRYTNKPGDDYNSFAVGTKVSVVSDGPPVSLDTSAGKIMQSIFDKVAALPDFQTEPIAKNSDYGFPDFMGSGKWTGYGNAGPKRDVMNILDRIPASYLAMEQTDNKGRVTRVYIDRSNTKNPQVLYFRGGIGGNDLIVALFEKGKLSKIDDMIAKAKDNEE